MDYKFLSPYLTVQFTVMYHLENLQLAFLHRNLNSDFSDTPLFSSDIPIRAGQQP
jgi:hypothetical protein